MWVYCGWRDNRGRYIFSPTSSDPEPQQQRLILYFIKKSRRQSPCLEPSITFIAFVFGKLWQKNWLVTPLGLVAYFERTSYAQHMFKPLLLNPRITRLTCFPASRFDSTNAFDVFDILGSCIRKGSAGWKSNAPRLIRPVPSSNLLQICNTESSCKRSKHKKEEDEFVKTKS